MFIANVQTITWARRLSYSEETKGRGPGGPKLKVGNGTGHLLSRVCETSGPDNIRRRGNGNPGLAIGSATMITQRGRRAHSTPTSPTTRGRRYCWGGAETTRKGGGTAVGLRGSNWQQESPRKKRPGGDKAKFSDRETGRENAKAPPGTVSVKGPK